MDSNKCSYLSISEQLIEHINNEIYREDVRFPSEFQLAKQFDVEIAVIRQTLQHLVDEKILIEKHGVGFFINPQPLFVAGIEELSSVSAMIHHAGMKPGTIFIDVSESNVTREEIDLFHCRENEALLTIKRVRTANNQPVVYCIDRVLRKNLSVGAEELLHTSIFEAIEQSGEIYIDRAVAEIEPVAYDIEASSILRCGVDVPLLALNQKHYSDEGMMILHSKNYFRADKFRFHVNRKRI